MSDCPFVVAYSYHKPDVQVITPLWQFLLDINIFFILGFIVGVAILLLAIAQDDPKGG